MFQTISYASLLVVAAGIVIHAFTRPATEPQKTPDTPRNPDAKPGKGRSWSCLAPGISCLSRLKRFAALFVVLCFIALFITGFAQRLLQGEAIHGWTLMAHVTAAPPFIVALAFAALTWANRCRLTGEDWAWVSSKLHRQPATAPADLGWKIAFWIATALAIPASLSIILMMYPLIGTHGQHTLFEIHRYTSLALSAAAFVHIYLFLQSRR